MATLTTSARNEAAGATVSRPVSGRRRIGPQAGHALEILGHAIDYLTDEYVHEGGTFCWHDPQLEALRLLMAANRQIYFECPQVPAFGERCRKLLGLG
ncbi:MAG: hypothetical protein WBE72_05315 [Terracidiphilus sp.]